MTTCPDCGATNGPGLYYGGWWLANRPCRDSDEDDVTEIYIDPPEPSAGFDDETWGFEEDDG